MAASASDAPQLSVPCIHGANRKRVAPDAPPASAEGAFAQDALAQAEGYPSSQYHHKSCLVSQGILTRRSRLSREKADYNGDEAVNTLAWPVSAVMSPRDFRRALCANRETAFINFSMEGRISAMRDWIMLPMANRHQVAGW